MKLGDLLPYLSMSYEVRIWLNGEIISRYNGKDSIPKEHNELLVEENGICVFDNTIDVYCYER